MSTDVFHSFEQAPLDETFGDGDDAMLSYAPWADPDAPPMSSLIASSLREGVQDLAVVRFAPAETVRRMVVPHPRDLRHRMRGFDVLALQRAVSKAGLRRWGINFTGQFGSGLIKDVKKFQRKHGLEPDGVYGAATHRALAPFYDHYGILLINRVHVRTPAQDRLAKLMTAAMILYNRRGVVHYTQGPGRMGIVRHRLDLRQLATVSSMWEDCSSSITGLRYVAGLSDPNRLGYSGYGFTGTMVEHGIPTNPWRAAPKGTCFFYGRYPPYHHVTMAVGNNVAFSHGSEYGPRLSTPHYRSDLAVARIYDGLPQ